jgi:predicted nucleic acid-binding protein
MPTDCVDTNIWFYALSSPTTGDNKKHEIARKLIIKLNRPLLTPQILNELTFNLVRKQKWQERELRKLIVDLRKRCEFFIPNENWHEQASLLREQYKLSFWDSLVVAAAQIAGCTTLFSEDMQHGFNVEGLTIINPFIIDL